MTKPSALATIIVFLLILFSAANLSAAFLRDMPMNLVQPDGTALSCFASGDEYHNWLHDSENYTIIQDAQSGFYCYATKLNDSVVASNLIAGKDDPRRAGLYPGINISEADYKARRESKFPMPAMRDAPTTGTINNIVIYIRFSGESEFGQNISIYDGWFNSSTSSQKNYFLEASYNQLTVNTSFYPAQLNNMVVSWQDSNPRSYYQPYNASTNPNGYNGDAQRTSREFTLLQNATNGVSSQIPSSLNIDGDNDGNVDNVVYIIKGNSDGWAELLWPHRWSLYDRYVYINGKRVYDFNFQLQDFLTSQNVGVICHEFFHTLGAPDLYHYTSNGISPAGSWDLMESNTNPPQHMGAYMKWKYGDWISSIPTITTDQLYTLNPLTSATGNAYRINSTVSSTEYFIVEFRKKTGTFENQIPGSGILIYRINTAAGNGNASGPPDEVYIYRPDGTNSVNGSIYSAHYSSETGRTAINQSTNPMPFLSNDAYGGLVLSNISSSSGITMSFVKGSPPVYTIDFSTNPHLESFDATSFPPEGWSNQATSGSYVYERVTSGTSPTCSPQNGAAMLRYNSYYAASGNSAILVSPRLNVSNVNAYSYNTSFYIYRDNGYSTNLDRIEVYRNSSADLSGSPILLGSIHRSRTQAPTLATNGWYQYSFNFANPSAGYHYIIYKAVSAYGNNIFVDNFSISRAATPPGIAINPSPANLSIGVSISHALSWSAGTGVTTGYKLYLGTNNPPTNMINGLDLGNVNSYNPSNLWAYSTTYYWKIVPYNEGVDATSSPIWSFTSGVDQTIAIPFVESFEDGFGGWTPVNGTQVNQWYVGNVISNSGEASAYISNDGGVSHAYTTTVTAISHFFRDVSFPAGTSDFTLRFDWRGGGQGSSVSYDYLRVFLIDPSSVPVAGTLLSSGQIGGTYVLNTAWQTALIPLNSNLAGTVKRLVFTWRNNASAGTQPPAAVDNIRIVIGSSNDMAAIIDGETDISAPSVISPDDQTIHPQLSISNLDTPDSSISITSSYATVEQVYPFMGLYLALSDADYGGSEIVIDPDLGFCPAAISYRFDTGNWIPLYNPGSWTEDNVAFSLPVSRETGTLQIAFPAVQTYSPGKPEVLISRSLNNINLQWQDIFATRHYLMQAADTPDGDFADLGITTGTSYQYPVESRKFYRVIAIP